MERYTEIINSEVFLSHVEAIEEFEKDREFCRHDIRHFLDVARIAMILNLQEGLKIEKDVIYAAALLHDVGRDLQYLEGIPHEMASAEIAEGIFPNTDYSIEERESIILAIQNHRNSEVKGEKSLSGILYRADKLSRPCFFCKAEKMCDWKKDKKNLELIL